uniref:Uncharacterized protein n=1 Tax=Rhizophora mucronata TaxID=61149 RepID=A0A2P2PYD8_RHIMU
MQLCGTSINFNNRVNLSSFV